MASKKRMATSRTLEEEAAAEQLAAEKLADDIMVAKGNRATLRAEVAKAKNEHKKLTARYNKNKSDSHLENKFQSSKLELAGLESDYYDADIELDRLKLQRANGDIDLDDNDRQYEQDEVEDIKTNIMIAQGNRDALLQGIARNEAIYKDLCEDLVDAADDEKPGLDKKIVRSRELWDEMKIDLEEVEHELKDLEENKHGVSLNEDLLFVPKEAPVDFTYSKPPIDPKDRERTQGDRIADKQAPVIPGLKQKPIDLTGDDIQQSNPKITVTDTSGIPVTSVEDDPEDLWSPAMARKAAGLSPDHFRIDGWKGGLSKTLVIGRGPPNASSFRLERQGDVDAVLEENISPDITLGRFGEMKNNKKKFIYGKNESPVIQAVAWLTRGVEKPLDLLIPTPKSDPKARAQTGEPKEKKKRVDIAIKIKWNINGTFHKSWETRTTVRRLYGHTQGDNGIYEAAKYQEKRYEEWQSGERKSLDRSPTPNPSPKALSPDHPAIPASTTKPAAAQGPTVIKQEKTEKSPIMQYKELWCELNDIDPSDMEEEEQANFLNAWQKRIPA